MRYWWVNGNHNYRQQIRGGYLWSPKCSANGTRNLFYETMREVVPGDLIFLIGDGHIHAIGIAQSDCHEDLKPAELGTTNQFGQVGWKVRTKFTELSEAIRPKDHMEALRRLLPEKYAPLQTDGRSIQSVFLAELPANFAKVLVKLIGPEMVANVLSAQNLLIQMMVVPGARASEGTLIEAVTRPWLDIVALLTADPSIAYQLPPEKWEEIVAGAYKRAGFDEVTLTPRSGDLGRDVIAIKKGIAKVRVIDQVKAFRPGRLVKANDVRALMGVLLVDGASKGFLTTTSDFAPRIRRDPLIAPLIPSRLELVNGKELLARLAELVGAR